jgi:precorrin-4/cobalt-precorrin-4 C11-methyltransferase
MARGDASDAVELPEGRDVTVHFVGAGPGAPDLLTLRAVRLLETCSVCLFAGSLVPTEVLRHCSADTRLVDTANLTLDEITAELINADRANLNVVRLCSGDPSVFSAIAEQIRRLQRAGVDYDITPGVPAFAAAAAALGVELTVPGIGQSVILTRIAHDATAMPAGEELATLGASGATLVLHLAVQRIESVVDQLLAHYGADCPVAVVAFASRDNELIIRSNLAGIASQVRSAGVRRTAVIIVGRVLAAHDFGESHLYSASRSRS